MFTMCVPTSKVYYSVPKVGLCNYIRCQDSILEYVWHIWYSYLRNLIVSTCHTIRRACNVDVSMSLPTISTRYLDPDLSGAHFASTHAFMLISKI